MKEEDKSTWILRIFYFATHTSRQIANRANNATHVRLSRTTAAATTAASASAAPVAE